MFTWGVIVFVGLRLLLADVAPVRRAKLMGNPWLIHTIVIGPAQPFGMVAAGRSSAPATTRSTSHRQDRSPTREATTRPRCTN